MMTPALKQAAPILLVEDSDDDQILMRRAFTQANLANPIHGVSDGDEAVAYLSGEGKYADRETYPLPILILLDLKLPKRSGDEVLQWLRAQPGLKRVPVAILTSSNEAVDINRAYDLGANAYLVKPVGFESLVELVKSLNLFWLILNEGPDMGDFAS
jgi:CheY-like chemotaxis protein